MLGAIASIMRKAMHATGIPRLFGWKNAYKGAEISRMNRHWIPPHRSADLAIREASPLLLARARDLVRNEPYAQRAKNRIVENVIGEGIYCVSAVEDDTHEIDEEFNREADAAFSYWCENEADFSGKLSFAEIQAIILGDVIEGGEILVVFSDLPDVGRSVPLSIQLVEPEQLDESHDRPPGDGVNEIRRGIEVDQHGRPVAYYIFDRHPNDIQAVNTWVPQRIPADRVEHVFRPVRSNQTRGVTWFAPIIQALKDMGWYLENELTASAIGALFTVAIKREHGAGSGIGISDGEDGADKNGNPLEALGPGIIADIGANDSVEMIETKRPNVGAEPWIKLLLQMIAAGLDLTYLELSGDYSAVNYSSARSANLSDRMFFRPLQKWMGRYVLRVRQRWLGQAVALGRIKSISPQQYERDRLTWSRCEMSFPGWDWVDPHKEAIASVLAIQNGLSTHKAELDKKGRDWRKVFEQLRREQDYRAKIGLELTQGTAVSVTKTEGLEESSEINEEAEESNA